MKEIIAKTALGLRRHRLVSRDAVLAVFAQAPTLNVERFRADLDAVLDQNPTPRG